MPRVSLRISQEPARKAAPETPLIVEQASALERHLTAWREDAILEGAPSAGTMANYVPKVTRLCAAIGPLGSVASLTRETIKSAIAKETSGSRHAGHMMLAAVRRFTSWLRSEGHLASDPTEGIRVKLPPSRRQSPRDGLVKDLFDAVDRLDWSTVKRARARAILSLLSECGLRRDELLALQLGDIDLESREIRIVRGKGGKSRVVVPPQHALDALRAYIDLRPAGSGGRDLWKCGRRPKLWRDGLYSLLHSLGRAAGLRGTRIIPHLLRHAYATRCLESGVPLNVIQTNLGHSDVATTARYIGAGDALQHHYAEGAALFAKPASVPPSPARTAKLQRHPPRPRQAPARGTGNLFDQPDP
ncbi:MAG: tyrosine-type recombinase/integrase [Acetobacteraceae bacterium]|nr:tyrosine-type recombinase/integrase [Acetobacteraceae bacterium]